jgi:hypothetical protein
MTPEPAQVRTIRVSATRVAEHELEVTGHLVDERPVGTGVDWLDDGHGAVIHDMRLTIRVRHPDLVITAVSGTMAEHPYTLCPDALPPLQQLVGLSVARGFTRAVNERFGRQHGCAHLAALVHAMAPVVRQGAGVAFHAAIPPSDARNALRRAARDPWFVNSCQAWREDGPLHRQLAAGDMEGMRALSARGRKREGA